MDNKNQNNDSVGDGLNLSHENQLPPIWDNISKELNALDGNPVSTNEPLLDAEEISDLADFSTIKEGFQTNFAAKEPPKFMWDKIEQDLESFTVTDAPSDFSAIKTGFEQNYKKTPAPNFTWEDLAEEMDNPKPKEKEEDYAFVKRGFEKQYSAVVVPLFSWADLAKRMDNEAMSGDTPDNYSIVKESFQKEFAAHKPAANTWAKLDQELQAQSHWRKALVLLFAPAFLKKAALFAAIGIFVLGGKFYLSEHPNSFKMPLGSVVADNQASFFEEMNIPSLKAAVARSYGNEDTEKQHSANTQDEINAALMLPKKDVFQSERKADAVSNNKTTSENTSNVSKEGENEDESSEDKVIDDVDATNNSQDPLLIDKAELAKSLANNLSILDSKNKTTINKVKALDQDEILRSNLKLSANRSDDYRSSGQEVMDVELLEDGLGILVQKYILDDKIPQMEEESFPLVRQMQKGKKIRFEIGLVGRGGTSILLGKNTYDAWGGENATTKLCPTAGFGVLANYHFSLNDAVVLGVYPYSTMEQCFGRYDTDGNYEETKLKLSLFDFTLGYQRTLIRYNSLSTIPSKIYARLDLGLGILMSAKTSVNEELINTDALYNQFNFSAGLALGNTHEIKQFVIDYGITGNVGMNNIVKVTNPTILEPANLLNVGAYLGVRYLIIPRLEPSKKQRQFDWSPPFYIEEPSF